MKKKFLIALLVICTMVCAFAVVNVSAATSGTCGVNLNWTLDDEGTLTISGQGDMYDWTSSSKVPWYSLREDIINVVIDDGATSIGDYAFCDCSSLISITIPESVTSIGNAAFRVCSSLISITIPDSVTSIGNSAFGSCYRLDKVNITDLESWCNIEFAPFESNPLGYAENLYLNGECVTDLVIPEGVTSICARAFYGCESLISITIPEGVTSIGDSAFSNCSSLTSITIPDGVMSIGSAAFESCSSLASITIPESVTSIGAWAFRGCSSLTSIIIPENVTSICAYAFCECSSLISITIPEGVTSIDYRAFRNCSSLTNITIPGSVTSIGVDAFRYCYSLESITIPEGVISIGDYAFCGCSSLISITISKGLTSIGYAAFYGCSSLTDVYCNGTDEDWNKISFAEMNDALTNATIRYGQVEYCINEITIKDMAGNSLQAIPQEAFLATVSFTNVSAGADTVILFAQYTETGAFKDFMYIQTEDVPTGSTIKLTIPVDNKNGDVANLKAFCLESFISMKVMSNVVSFPAE